MPGSAARRALEDAQQQLRLAVAGEAGEADDLALMGDELGAVALALGAGADADRRAAARARGVRVGAARACASLRRPWR